MRSEKRAKKETAARKKKCKADNYFLYDLAKVTGIIPVMIWMRPKVLRPFGKHPIKGGFILSSNHVSFFDPIAILCAFWKRRVFSLATTELYDTPGKRWIFENMKCIPVDKQNFSLDSFHEVTRRLKKGKVICIFPEGQINFHSNDMLAFKSGMILMAHTANVPILPIYLVPVKRRTRRRIVVVGEPIHVRAMCGRMPSAEDLNRVADYVHEKEQELKSFYDSKFHKNTSEAECLSDPKEEVVSK